MSSLEKNTGRDCQPRGNVTVFNPADNRSASRAHRRLRCVWLKQHGMWFGVKVLISWPLCLESSWCYNESSWLCAAGTGTEALHQVFTVFLHSYYIFISLQRHKKCNISVGSNCTTFRKNACLLCSLTRLNTDYCHKEIAFWALIGGLSAWNCISKMWSCH